MRSRTRDVASGLVLLVVCLVAGPPGRALAAPRPASRQASDSVRPVRTLAEARRVAQAEVRRQPAAAGYRPDAIELTDTGERWQVRVPRWRGLPRAGYFEIEKATGRIHWTPAR